MADEPTTQADSFLLPPWEGVAVGTQVLYELYPGVERPAVVVRTFQIGANNEPLVNLCVFLDGRNDEALVKDHYGFTPGNLTFWVTSCHYAPGIDKKHGTWHWPLEGGE